LTVVLIDVDHFKDVNTNFLHPGGDHTLIWLAGVLQNSIRALDSLGRVGGEEFQVIAPNTDTTGAMVLAERLRENVASGSTIYNGNTVLITISLGVAVIESSLLVAYDELRECAAKALKEAKDAGRNCCVVRQYTIPTN